MPRVGSVRLGSARFGSALSRLGSARFGLARLGGLFLYFCSALDSILDSVLDSVLGSLFVWVPESTATAVVKAPRSRVLVVAIAEINLIGGAFGQIALKSRSASSAPQIPELRKRWQGCPKWLT